MPYRPKFACGHDAPSNRNYRCRRCSHKNAESVSEEVYEKYEPKIQALETWIAGMEKSKDLSDGKIVSKPAMVTGCCGLSLTLEGNLQLPNNMVARQRS